MSPEEPKKEFDALGVIGLALASVFIIGGATLWWGNRPVKPASTYQAPADSVRRVAFTSETKHDAAGQWVTTKSFPQDEVGKLIAAGFRIAAVDEASGMVTMTR